MDRIDGIKIMEKIDGINVINICDWMKDYFGEDNWMVEYFTSGRHLTAWCLKNNASYYAAPRESFSIYEGVQNALNKGHFTVIVEDLS